MTQPAEELANVAADISGRPGRRYRGGQVARLIAQVGDNTLAIIGVVSSIAGFTGLVTSGQLRKFVKLYPYPICIALIITLLALLISLNYAQTMRRQRSHLQAAAQALAEPRPSAHDVRLFAEALVDLPLDGPVITWLRRTEAATLDPADIPADVLTALDRTVGRLDRRPVGFDDEPVAQELADFLVAVENYRVNLENWTLGRHNIALAGHDAAWVGATAGVRPTGPDWVTGALADSQQRLLRAYDSFILTAHKRGMDMGL